jgi:cytochrome P450
VAPDELAFNTPAAWEDIYGHRVGHPNMAKDPIQVGAIEKVPGAPALTMAADAVHSRQRRAFAYAFSQKALQEQESIVQGYVSKLMDHLRQKAVNNEPFNIVKWFNFTAFDVIGDLAFGESFGCLKEGQYTCKSRCLYPTWV